MPPYEDSGLPLWCTVWVEQGEKKVGPSGSKRTATRVMLNMLQNDIPAWIEYIPYYSDDDIPF